MPITSQESWLALILLSSSLLSMFSSITLVHCSISQAIADCQPQEQPGTLSLSSLFILHLQASFTHLLDYPIQLSSRDFSYLFLQEVEDILENLPS